METPKPQFFKQNLYAVKTLWGLSKKRVIHGFIDSAVGYFEWLFGSIFFIWFVIGAIEDGAGFGTVAGFVLITVLLLGVCSLYSTYAQNAVFPMEGHKIRRGLYKDLFAKANNVELRCYEDADFYNRYTMALDDADGRVTRTASTFFNIITGVIASAVAFYTMFTIDPFVVIFMVSPIVGNFFFGALHSRLDGVRYSEKTPFLRKSAYVGRVLYLAEFAKEVRMSNIFNLMKLRFGEAVQGVREVAHKHGNYAAFLFAMRNVASFAIVFQGIMLYAAYRTIVSQTIGIAELAIMLSAMTAMSWIFIGLFGYVTESLKNCVFIGYMRIFLNYEEQIPEDQDGIIPSGKIDLIEFKNVSFEYADGEAVIDDCSFIIKGGQTVAFAGHNGAGKSTLIKLLFRLYDPTNGGIFLNGINIKEYNLAAYRRLFSAAFQDYKIFSMSVADNVALDEKTEIPAENALKQAGVWEEINRLSNGINTTLTKEFDPDGAVLSEGTIQKVIAARAFAKNAPIQVYDEPSSALDPIAEYDLYTGIMAASRGHTTLFISHRLSSVADADYIFVMEHGKIIEQGKHSALMADKGEYSKMFTMQAESYLAEALS